MTISVPNAAFDFWDTMVAHILELAKAIHRDYNDNRLKEFPDKLLDVFSTPLS